MLRYAIGAAAFALAVGSIDPAAVSCAIAGTLINGLTINKAKRTRIARRLKLTDALPTSRCTN